MLCGESSLVDEHRQSQLGEKKVFSGSCFQCMKSLTYLSGSSDVAVRVVVQRADAPLRKVVRPLRDVSLGRHPHLALELFRHLVHNLFPSVLFGLSVPSMRPSDSRPVNR